MDRLSMKRVKRGNTFQVEGNSNTVRTRAPPVRVKLQGRSCGRRGLELKKQKKMKWERKEKGNEMKWNGRVKDERRK